MASENTMVVRLDPPHRHKNVLNIIENFDRIGFNELYEKLREKSQTSMAKSTLKKVVDELVENKMIARIPKGKQSYQFTVDVKSVKKLYLGVELFVFAETWSGCSTKKCFKTAKYGQNKWRHLGDTGLVSFVSHTTLKTPQKGEKSVQ